MIYVNYICNGCGLYSHYSDDRRKHLNSVEVDMTNYVLFTSGFKLKEPRATLLFCNACMASIMDGEVRVKAMGDTEALRQKIEIVEKENERIKDELRDYRYKVSSLLVTVAKEQGHG